MAKVIGTIPVAELKKRQASARKIRAMKPLTQSFGCLLSQAIKAKKSGTV